MHSLIQRVGGARAHVRRIFGAGLLIIAGLGFSPARAADLDGPAWGAAPPVVAYGGVGVDARCRIIPAPELNLVGDTARFRPQAVCQSRGLYADSLGFPEPPVFYGYAYGYAR